MLYFPQGEVIYLDFQKISVCLIGNATKDAEVKQAKESHNQYGDFRLAVRNKKGETTYFPIRCFGKLAEGLTAIKKGAKVFVEGELEISSFAGEEGSKRMTFRVLANTYRLLGNGRRLEAGDTTAE
jgi:single stranded DNA-binding protein